jgi:hypothetical protein
MPALREILKSVIDIPHMLKKFNSPSSFCTSSNWHSFLKSKVICLTTMKPGQGHTLFTRKQGYEEQTTLQYQALLIVLSGRDTIGIAKTDSVKTAAFVLPMIVHIMDQPELEKEEAMKFAKPYNPRVAAVYGGVSKYNQFKELKADCEVLSATPGRLIDLLKMKVLRMFRATYLALDADIKQVVIVLLSDAEKMLWPLEKLPGMIDNRERAELERFQNCSTPWRQGSCFSNGDIAEILTKPIMRNTFKFNH